MRTGQVRALIEMWKRKAQALREYGAPDLADVLDRCVKDLLAESPTGAKERKGSVRERPLLDKNNRIIPGSMSPSEIDAVFERNPGLRWLASLREGEPSPANPSPKSHARNAAQRNTHSEAAKRSWAKRKQENDRNETEADDD